MFCFFFHSARRQGQHRSCRAVAALSHPNIAGIFELIVFPIFGSVHRGTRFVVLALSRYIILLIGYVIYSIYRSGSGEHQDEEEDHKDMKIVPALILVIASSGGLALGASLLVDNAIILARDFGMSERIISVSLIAVGTSIPELTTSAIAAFRKHTDISIGNIIGSNIFNLGFVLGITSMVKPLEVNPLILSFDIYWLFGIALILMGMLFIPPRLILSRWKGLVMLSIYLIYLYIVLQ